MVCARCAADWATCPEPSGRVVRLGMTARVRDIDPLGRLAVVTHWRRPARIFDLRQLRWADMPPLSRMLWLARRTVLPRLTPDERLMYPLLAYDSDYGYSLEGVSSRTLRTGDEHELRGLPDDMPSHDTQVSATGNIFSYATDSQRVVVVRPDGSSASYEPLPRKVIQASCIDGERDILTSASWSEIALHHMQGNKLDRIGYTRTAAEGDVRWLGLAGSSLAAAVYTSSGTHVEVRRLGDDRSIGPVVQSLTATWGFRVAALSRDGRYLAAAFTDKLTVLDLDSGHAQQFDEHSDTINAVRFAADDHVLISADTDNRVVLRPRTPAGYAKPLISVEPGSA